MPRQGTVTSPIPANLGEIGEESVGSHSVTTSNDKTETLVFEVTKIDNYRISAYFDVNALVAAVEGGTVTFRYYNKIDETTYRLIGSSVFIVGTDVVHPSIEAVQIHHNFKVTIQCSTDVTTTRAVPYYYVIQDL
jgi:hypothetical protein